MRTPRRLVLLGHPVSHSLSPRFQNAALADAGLNIRYETLDVAPSDFDATVAMLKSEGAAGNVTIPYKERACAACDALTPLARRVGAVNTFWRDDEGRLVGDNTDVGGIDAAVRDLLGDAPRDITVGLLGAGGAAAAVLAAAERWHGCSVRVHNRTPARARALCERFRAVAQPVDDIRRAADVDLLVNATSVGLRNDDVPVDLSFVARNAAVLDLVYRTPETRFVHALRERGHRARDGITMLIEQGALAFELWFGTPPNRSVMWRAVQA